VLLGRDIEEPQPELTTKETEVAERQSEQAPATV